MGVVKLAELENISGVSNKVRGAADNTFGLFSKDIIDNFLNLNMILYRGGQGEWQ